MGLENGHHQPDRADGESGGSTIEFYLTYEPETSSFGIEIGDHAVSLTILKLRLDRQGNLLSIAKLRPDPMNPKRLI